LGDWPPEAFASEAGRKAPFHIVLADGLFDRRDVCFHLDNEQARRWRMPREKVDRTSLSIDSERHFDLRHPTASLQERGDSTDEHGMTLVKQAVELTTAPSDDLDQVRVEDGEDPCDRGHCQVVDLAALEARDLALTDPSPPRDVDLAPAQAMSQGSGDAAEAKVAHPMIVAHDAHPGLDWLRAISTSQSRSDHCEGFLPSGIARHAESVRRRSSADRHDVGYRPQQSLRD
jgi:hypothetical protein